MAGERLLLAEDDEALSVLIAEGLGRWGYEVLRVDGSGDVAATVERERPELLILDVNLPRFDGFYWCRRIRESSTLPILFLSARAEGMDAVMGMSSGGDDYMTKPFSLELLVAKVGALLRRAYAYAESPPERLARGGAVLDLGRSRIEHGGASAELTRNELKLLAVLMRRGGEAVPKKAVMEALWSDEIFVDENTLNVAVNRLRRKLEGIGLSGFVRTRKGLGYEVP